MTTAELHVLRRFHRIGWTRGKHFRIGFQCLLISAMPRSSCVILAIDHRGRIIFDDDVGIHAMAFDDPFPVDGSCGKFRNKDLATVDQRAAAGDADNAAPSALADQRPKPACLNMYGKMSPSEAEVSLIRQTFGP